MPPRTPSVEEVNLVPLVPPGFLFLVSLFVVTPVVGRYRKGRTTLIGNLWWEAHEDCMIVCAEALLPLAITAIFATGGPHSSGHAKWGEDTQEMMTFPTVKARGGGENTWQGCGGY